MSSPSDLMVSVCPVISAGSVFFVFWMTGFAPRRSKLGAGGTGSIVGAVVVVLAVSGVMAFAGLSTDETDELQAVVAAAYTGECVTSDSAEARVRDELAAAGFAEWKILSRAASDDCVAAGLDPSTDTVILVPVDHSDVTSAMGGAAKKLMSRCMDERHGSEFVSSVLGARPCRSSRSD